MLMFIWSKTKICIHVHASLSRGHCSDCCVAFEGNHFDVPVADGGSIFEP